jgi:succinyl-CoA synthetase beta subunit
MKIHEYQAKELFSKHQIPIPEGYLATSGDEAVKVADTLGGYPVVVKAQIHAGGRGKGGGVKLAWSRDEVYDAASSILGMNLVTHQTDAQGQAVKKVLVEQGLDIAQELYISVIPDRTTAKVVIMASMAGGMDIEEVAEKSPEKIIKVSVDPMLGIQPYHCRQVAFGLDVPAEARKECMALVNGLFKLLMTYDCSLVEINPLVVTSDNRLLALDAKINFDDNALFRHKDILEYRDVDEEDPLEVEASNYGLNYIKMDGNIGNMVNGAGLAMATMDIIKKAGAEPANFLDVGGGASAEMVENGFRIILGDSNVKGIFINIFGGILRCDVLAQGVVQAASKVGLNVPVVVRMEGTNVEQGRQILAESGLDLRTAKDLADAARQVAALVN